MTFPLGRGAGRRWLATLARRFPGPTGVPAGADSTLASSLTRSPPVDSSRVRLGGSPGVANAPWGGEARARGDQARRYRDSIGWPTGGVDEEMHYTPAFVVAGLVGIYVVTSLARFLSRPASDLRIWELWLLLRRRR